MDEQEKKNVKRLYQTFSRVPHKGKKIPCPKQKRKRGRRPRKGERNANFFGKEALPKLRGPGREFLVKTW